MTEKFDKVLESNDKLAGKMDKILLETASHSVFYKEHKEILDDHEERIKILELQPTV